MLVRRAILSEINSIMDIYEGARLYMASHGNPLQWPKGYIRRERVMKDIERGECYVCTASKEGAASPNSTVGDTSDIEGVFTLRQSALGESAYSTIVGEGWHYNLPYAVIHRLASRGRVRGIARSCFEYSSSKYNYLRIDTHKDNSIMQKAILEYGFRPCGVVTIALGQQRIAYDYLRPSCT